MNPDVHSYQGWIQRCFLPDLYLKSVGTNIEQIYKKISNYFNGKVCFGHIGTWGSLIICYYLISMQSWPEDALEAVAKRSLGDIEMSERIRVCCIDMCKSFHTTTIEMSETFYTELQRYNYVTPTSYLELISTFQALLELKRT